jgi:uncharacterized protein YacL
MKILFGSLGIISSILILALSLLRIIDSEEHIWMISLYILLSISTIIYLFETKFWISKKDILEELSRENKILKSKIKNKELVEKLDKINNL